MQGWIKLHRKLMEKSIWLNSTPEQKVVLITLLLLANHSENEWEWQGKEYVCRPGQFITSSASIEAHSGKGLSRQKIRTAIDRFKKLGFLTIETTSVNSLITICKWDTYQKSIGEDNQVNNKRITKTQPTPNQQVTTNKNDNNDKNEKNANKETFDIARKTYPGTKRGLDIEYAYFQKTCTDWKEVVVLLLPAIAAQARWRCSSGGEFRPEWKDFKSWIYNKYWTLEVTVPKSATVTKEDNDLAQWSKNKQWVQSSDLAALKAHPTFMANMANDRFRAWAIEVNPIVKEIQCG